MLCDTSNKSFIISILSKDQELDFYQHSLDTVEVILSIKVVLILKAVATADDL